MKEEECQPRLNTNIKRLNCKPSRSPVPRLVFHFTRSLLHKKHPPPHLPASCYYQYYGGGSGPALGGQPPVREAGGSWGYCSEVRLLMIISDNPPPPHWPVLADYRQDEPGRGGAGRQLRRRRGRPASPGHWSSLSSSLAAITQINKLSESHINLTTSEAIEAIEAMCHLRVFPNPRPPAIYLATYSHDEIMKDICKCDRLVSSETKNKKLFSTEITRHWFAERLCENVMPMWEKDLETN